MERALLNFYYSAQRAADRKKAWEEGEVETLWIRYVLDKGIYHAEYTDTITAEEAWELKKTYPDLELVRRGREVSYFYSTAYPHGLLLVKEDEN